MKSEPDKKSDILFFWYLNSHAVQPETNLVFAKYSFNFISLALLRAKCRIPSRVGICCRTRQKHAMLQYSSNNPAPTNTRWKRDYRAPETLCGKEGQKNQPRVPLSCPAAGLLGVDLQPAKICCQAFSDRS